MMESIISSRCEDAINIASSEEVIYCDRQKLFIKSKGKDDRNKFLKLAVSLVTLIGPVSEKSVAMKIIDDEDPFVYYTLIINESDFLSLKEQQGLLIDYDKFPQQLIKLFDLCKHADTSPWKYHLVLEELTPEPFGSCKVILKVIETNQFKQLCHLSLAIHVGTDSEIKRHLANQMSMLRDSLTQAECRADRAELLIQEVEKKLEIKGKELEEVQVRWREESNNYHQQARQELTAERDNFLKIQLDMKNSFESEKKHLQDMLNEKKNTFEKLVDNLQAENKALFEKNCDLQSKFRETSQELSNAQEQIQVLQNDKEKLRTQGYKLDIDYHDKEKSLNALKTCLAVLEQELRDKNVLLDQQKKLLQLANEQKVFLQCNLEQKEDSFQKKQISMSSLSQELCKANEIILKLSNEVGVLKCQLKSTKVFMSEQEQLLFSKEKELVNLKMKVDENVKIISTLELSEKKLKQDLEAAEKKITEKDAALSNNSNLINWLNHRLNEVQTFTPKEVSKEQKVVGSTITHTSTPLLPAYLQITKRMFDTTALHGDRFSSNSENCNIRKTDATTSQTSQNNNNHISLQQTSAIKLSADGKEITGLQSSDGRGTEQLSLLPLTAVAKVSAVPDHRSQGNHPHTSRGSSNENFPNDFPDTQRRKTCPFQYFSRQ